MREDECGRRRSAEKRCSTSLKRAGCRRRSLPPMKYPTIANWIAEQRRQKSNTQGGCHPALGDGMDGPDDAGTITGESHETADADRPAKIMAPRLPMQRMTS